MRSLFDSVAKARRIAQQEEELAALRAELERTRADNARLKAAMRRCVTCDYRLEVRAQRSEHKLLGRAEVHDEQDEVLEDD